MLEYITRVLMVIEIVRAIKVHRGHCQSLWISEGTIGYIDHWPVASANVFFRHFYSCHISKECFMALFCKISYV